jgi:hypothetical protein
MLMRSRSDCLEARGRFDRVGRFLPGARGAEKSIHRMAAEKRIRILNSRITDGRRPRAFGAPLTSKFRYARVSREMNG